MVFALQKKNLQLQTKPGRVHPKHIEFPGFRAEWPVPRRQRRRPAPEAAHLLRLHQTAGVQGTHHLAENSDFDSPPPGQRFWPRSVCCKMCLVWFYIHMHIHIYDIYQPVLFQSSFSARLTFQGVTYLRSCPTGEVVIPFPSESMVCFRKRVGTSHQKRGSNFLTLASSQQPL